MKILAIETATEACSTALMIDHVIIEHYQVAPRAHNRLIIPMIESLLSKANIHLNQLDALAFGRGPGSFTGIRIAASVAQGIALGADLPVIPISSLAALAQEVFDEHNNTITYGCLDARMGEVYWGIYRKNEQGLAQLIGTESVSTPEQAFLPCDCRGIGTGNGWQTYELILKKRLKEHVEKILTQCFPRAKHIALLAREKYHLEDWVSPEQAIPLYIRNQVVKKFNTVHS